MDWLLIEDEKMSAQANMHKDALLLDELKTFNRPILHLYEWESDSATYGYFLDPSKFLHMPSVEKLGLQLARRPTGGGIIFHLCDLAFSALVPHSHPAFSDNTLENYAFINRKVIQAVTLFLKNESNLQLLEEEPQPLDAYCKGFCMAKPTKYDVMLNGRKVGGAAQRKTKWGFLHQGSIALAQLPTQYLQDILLPHSKVLEGMQQNSFFLLNEWSQDLLRQSRSTMRKFLKQVFRDE